MKVAILNKNDAKGGAARAALQWHKTLLENGIDSTFMVENAFAPAETTFSPSGKLRKIYNVFKSHFDDAWLNFRYPLRNKYPWGLNLLPSKFDEIINSKKPDLVNLHWISNETISWDELAKIEAPIVWTMHDMWALTGGCHYSYGCEKYLTHCHKCPQLKSETERDISFKQFEIKIKLLQKKKITVIACSEWLGNCFKASPLYKNMPVHVVPNPIDTDVFKPIHKSEARDILNLPADKKLILFMAFSATTDIRKGSQYLPAMLEKLSATYNENEIELVIAGASFDNGSVKTKFKKHFLGTVSDDWSLALIHTACDVLIAPSREENLSMAVMEAMSCGTPVVAFNIGGMPDMIKHQKNGYLAKPFEPEDLAEGIKFVFNNSDLGSEARKYVLAHYKKDIVFQKIQAVFQSALKG